MSQPLIDILNEALKIEYTVIVHYPRLASMVSDEEVRKLVNTLGAASVQHADLVAAAISRLGGTPNWAFEPWSFDGLVGLFETQLDRETAARRLHAEAAGLVDVGSLRAEFLEMAAEEESHIKMVKEIIARLSA